MITYKQKLLFENLKNIKDIWTDSAVESLRPNADLFSTFFEEEYILLANKLSSERELMAFQKIQNEIIQGVIHSILVMMDGGDDLADKILIDLVDRGTKECLHDDIALHEEFIGYLIDVEEE